MKTILYATAAVISLVIIVFLIRIQLYATASVISLTVIVFLIREFFIFLKKPAREGDLRRAINKILDFHGCIDALNVYKECEHLVEHYHLDLNRCGFNGDMWDLFAEAGRSLKRAEARKEKADREKEKLLMEKPDYVFMERL